MSDISARLKQLVTSLAKAVKSETHAGLLTGNKVKTVLLETSVSVKPVVAILSGFHSQSLGGADTFFHRRTGT